MHNHQDMKSIFCELLSQISLQTVFPTVVTPTAVDAVGVTTFGKTVFEFIERGGASLK